MCFPPQWQMQKHMLCYDKSEEIRHATIVLHTEILAMPSLMISSPTTVQTWKETALLLG